MHESCVTLHLAAPCRHVSHNSCPRNLNCLVVFNESFRHPRVDTTPLPGPKQCNTLLRYALHVAPTNGKCTCFLAAVNQPLLFSSLHRPSSSSSHDLAIILSPLLSFFLHSFLATETENVKHERGTRPREGKEGDFISFPIAGGHGIEVEGGVIVGIGLDDDSVISSQSPNLWH